MEPSESGTRCTVCNIVMKSKKPSNLKEHIESKIHRKNAERISQVAGSIQTSTLKTADCLS